MGFWALGLGFRVEGRVFKVRGTASEQKWRVLRYRGYSFCDLLSDVYGSFGAV